MIRAKEISFGVREKTLVDRVSLEIPEGEVLAILGPNGAGKSTLFKMLCGQISPHAGQISYGGEPLESMDIGKLARRRAVLPQSSQIPFDFTAFEIALLGRSPHLRGSESRRDLALVKAAMALTETESLADQLAATLSGGELQRVHLARVLAQVWEPVEEGVRVLFMDEPTSNLDLSHQHGTLRLARRWAKEGAAVAIILHDLNLAALYADRLLILKGGKLIASGKPREILTAKLIQDTFNLKTLVRDHPENGGALVIAL